MDISQGIRLQRLMIQAMEQQHLKDYLAIADEIGEVAEVNMLTQIA